MICKGSNHHQIHDWLWNFLPQNIPTHYNVKPFLIEWDDSNVNVRILFIVCKLSNVFPDLFVFATKALSTHKKIVLTIKKNILQDL